MTKIHRISYAVRQSNCKWSQNDFEVIQIILPSVTVMCVWWTKSTRFVAQTRMIWLILTSQLDHCVSCNWKLTPREQYVLQYVLQGTICFTLQPVLIIKLCAYNWYKCVFYLPIWGTSESSKRYQRRKWFSALEKGQSSRPQSLTSYK